MTTHNTIDRRALLAAPALLALPAAAQGWPARPVRLIVPYAAGGGTDLMMRAVAEALRPTLPHPVVVENRAGGAGVIGSEVAARAAPDGHTLLASSTEFAINPALRPKLPYDALRDFAPVTQIGALPLILIVATLQPLLTGDVKQGVRNLSIAVFGFAYLPLLLGHFALLYTELPGGAGFLLLLGLATRMLM